MSLIHIKDNATTLSKKNLRSFPFVPPALGAITLDPKPDISPTQYCDGTRSPLK